jgi:hypothetical protein
MKFREYGVGVGSTDRETINALAIMNEEQNHLPFLLQSGRTFPFSLRFYIHFMGHHEVTFVSEPH